VFHLIATRELLKREVLCQHPDHLPANSAGSSGKEKTSRCEIFHIGSDKATVTLLNSISIPMAVWASGANCQQSRDTTTPE
jgi:hypothetical protein